MLKPVFVTPRIFPLDLKIVCGKFWGLEAQVLAQRARLLEIFEEIMKGSLIDDLKKIVSNNVTKITNLFEFVNYIIPSFDLNKKEYHVIQIILI